MRAQQEKNPVLFVVGDQVRTAGELLETAPKRKSRQAAAVSQSFHRGFRVEGHPPGAMESARDAALALVSAWDSMPADRQARELANGRRRPKDWDEAAWLRDTKRRPVRHKPYEVASAAEQCRDMAIRAGWLCVSIVEVKRGDTPPEGSW